MDLTTRPVRFGIASANGPLSVEVLSELSLPWRVAIQLDENDELHRFTGNETLQINEYGHTLIFDEVQTSIPRIKDKELRALLLGELWKAVGQTLGSFLSAHRPPPIYVISPYFYSQSLLDEMREASLSGPVRLAGFVHEAASLLLGTIQTDIFSQMTEGLSFHELATLSLIAAYEDASVDVACFDYSLEGDGSHRILIRDYFHTTDDNLRTRLEKCDWLDQFAKLLLLASQGCDAESNKALTNTLRTLSLDAAVTRHEILKLTNLKMTGAAHIARCCGGTGDKSRYVLDIVYNIGVQVEQDRFHPILSKDEMSRLTIYPHTVAQTLQVQGDPGNQMRLDLYCGQSDVVGDGILLGGFTLSRQDLMANASTISPLALFATMKTPGSGEITLGLLENDRVIDRVPFTVPALVV
jgi:hypothetical protein